MDTKSQFSTPTVILHWLIALTMIGLLAVGFYMANTKAYDLYPIHKSVGAIVFFFAILRLVWRFMNGWPTPLSDNNKLELLAANISHWVLLLGTLLMPLSGMTMSAAGGRGVYIFGLELIGRNPNPADPSKIAPINESLAAAASSMHTLAGYLVAAVVVLHIAGAMKHHLVYKDGTLHRMFGKRVDS